MTLRRMDDAHFASPDPGSFACRGSSALAQDAGTLDKTAAAADQPSTSRRRRRRSCSGANQAGLDCRPIHRRLCQGAASRARSRCRSTGPTWQVMRLSRNRNWGHPELIAFLERFANRAATSDGWRGPARRRHVAAARRTDADRPRQPSDRPRRRHLVDADARPVAFARRARDACPRPIWSPTIGRDVDPNGVDPKHGTELIQAPLRQDAEVERFPSTRRSRRHCATRPVRTGLARKVRPWLGHDYHFHVRMRCPADNASCDAQQPAPVRAMAADTSLITGSRRETCIRICPADRVLADHGEPAAGMSPGADGALSMRAAVH